MIPHVLVISEIGAVPLIQSSWVAQLPKIVNTLAIKYAADCHVDIFIFCVFHHSTSFIRFLALSYVTNIGYGLSSRLTFFLTSLLLLMSFLALMTFSYINSSSSSVVGSKNNTPSHSFIIFFAPSTSPSLLRCANKNICTSIRIANSFSCFVISYSSSQLLP